MNIKKLSLAAAVSALTFTTATNAVLGPIPIYLNTEYRTDAPVIGSIASTLSFGENDIKATGASTFLDFLATVPSVGLHEGTVPAVFMRGSESYHTLVIVDGVSIHDIDANKGAVQYGLTSISLNDIEKVEIIKGSGSVLYGSSAISGVISITTKKGADGERTIVNTKFGTNNTKTYALSTSSGNKDGFVRFTHNKYTTDGINAQAIDLTGEKDAISNRSTQIKLGNDVFDITYLVTNNKTEYDDTQYVNSSLTENQPNNLGVRDLSKISANITKKFSDTWKTKLSLAQTSSKRDTYSAGLHTVGDKYKSTDVTILNDIKINNALLNIGLSKFDDKNTTENTKISSKEVFANWQKNIDNVDINVGARYINTDSGNKTIYNLGAAKYLDNGIKLTGNHGTSFKAPTLTMIEGTSDYWYAASPDVKPETSKNIELGIEKQHNWGLSSIKVFKMKVKNRFNQPFAYGTTGYGTWINEESYATKGIELLVSSNLAGYNINLDHTYSKSSQNHSDTQPVRRPKNITNLTISKQYGKFNSRLQVIKKSSSLDSNPAFFGPNETLEGYTLVNLSTNYAINNNVKVSLTIKNATNKYYATATAYNTTASTANDIFAIYNNPGRAVSIGLEYKF